MIQSVSTRKTYDTAIIGAGVLGLWAARHAIKRGEKVMIVEKRMVGAGASGGFLGALMPHMPDSWNGKKQLQYDGLTSLPMAVTALEDDTGVVCGYRRCGRIMPLLHEKTLPQVERRVAGARNNWDSEFGLDHYQAESDAVCSDDWLNPELTTSGIQADTLSARINPRAYLNALNAYVHPRAVILEQAEVIGLEISNDGGRVKLLSGDTINAGKIIIANGWEAYPLLQPFMEELNEGKPIGRGVKGQAVLVNFAHNDELPIVYHDGTYVVPHAGNFIAIGSTSVNEWDGEPDAFDPIDTGFYDRAVSMVPALNDAPIIARWAGVRPRNTLEGRGTSPWFGPVPGQENLIALIGGFKITLGVAHLNFENRPFTV